jgi:hypothetical protein
MPALFPLGLLRQFNEHPVAIARYHADTVDFVHVDRLHQLQNAAGSRRIVVEVEFPGVLSNRHPVARFRLLTNLASLFNLPKTGTRESPSAHIGPEVLVRTGCGLVVGAGCGEPIAAAVLAHVVAARVAVALASAPLADPVLECRVVAPDLAERRHHDRRRPACSFFLEAAPDLGDRATGLEQECHSVHMLRLPAEVWVQGRETRMCTVAAAAWFAMVGTNHGRRASSWPLEGRGCEVVQPTRVEAVQIHWEGALLAVLRAERPMATAQVVAVSLPSPTVAAAEGLAGGAYRGAAIRAHGLVEAHVHDHASQRGDQRGGQHRPKVGEMMPAAAESLVVHTHTADPGSLLGSGVGS